MFLLPNVIYDKLNVVFALFMWINRKGNQVIHWKQKEVAERPKGRGRPWSFECPFV